MGKELEKPERIRPRQAAGITGLTVRAIQAMALRGEIPGAAKLGGSWTFDEAKLRAWIAEQVEKNESRAKGLGSRLPSRREEKAMLEARARLRELIRR